MTDLELLRAYEPVVRYTKGELFHPIATDGYVRRADLFSVVPGTAPVLLVPAGELTLDRLAAAEAPAGATLYLRFVQRPLDRLQLAAWQRRPGRVPFRSPGRLARVGLFARLVDAGFNGSLQLRGTVPGGTAAAAAQKYESIRAEDPRYVYHGRVVRRDGWIVLHYLFFYAMNDWRSTFFGANDHEADLEQAFVVLEDPDGAEPRPAWIGFAAHDYTGDDLRRRWDDPLVSRVGDHPVIHAGAGSHAAYFEAGDYVTTVPLPASRRLRGAFEGLRRFWRDTLRQDDPGDLAARFEGTFSIPFVDYARGDGLAIGPGGDAGWTPVLVDDDVPWVDRYRGLWGLDTRDRFGGERAPAGLKYTRMGTTRQSWNDPLGFLGLDKVTPPSRLAAALAERAAALAAERDAVREEAEAKATILRERFVEADATAGDATLAKIHDGLQEQVAALEAEVAGLRAREDQLRDTLLATADERRRVEAGDLRDPQAHLHHQQRPQPPSDQRYGRLVELWAAVSASVLLIVLIGPLALGLLPWWAALGIAVGGYIVIEAAFRRRLIDLLLRITVLLAIVGALVLAWTYATQVVVLAIVAVALLTLAENVRELRA